MDVKKALALAGSLVLAVACSSNNNGADGGGTDGSAKDGSVDAKADAKDTGVPDTQSNTCPTPADVTGFQPGTPTPPHAALKVCQSGDYAAYFTACLDASATSQTCQTWSMAHQTCADCIASNADDLQWGAVVFGSGVESVNVAGCLELVGAAACSKATSDVDQCLGAACDIQCPVTDDPSSFQLYQQCTTKAEAGGCKTYSTAADAACDADANPAIAQCSGSDLQSQFLNVGPVFCGP